MRVRVPPAEQKEKIYEQKEKIYERKEKIYERKYKANTW